MPNRLLREGIVDSERLDAVSADAECMFYRLLVVADDFGRMDARPAILRARCFPLKETLSATKIESWLTELANFRLILRYEATSRPFLAIGRWDQRVRSNGKYPPPSADEWLSYVGQLSDICPSYDGLGKGKGKGKGASSAQPAADAGDAGPVTILLPTCNSTEYPITESQCAEWGTLFPAVDVPQELRCMRAWLDANPAKRKTESGMKRFATSWLSRAQNRPRTPALSGGDLVFAGAK